MYIPVSSSCYKPVADLVIMHGQSQVHGLSGTAYLPQVYTSAPIPNAYIWTDYAFEALEANVNHTAGTTGANDAVGPLLSMAQAIGEDTTTPTFYVLSSVGGTNLAVDWNPSTGILYERAIHRDLEAIAHLQAQGYTVRIKALVWFQGETDAGNLTNANNYATNLAALFAAFRSDLSAPGLKFIVPGLSSKNTTTYKATVRAAQESVAAADSNAVLIDPDDYPDFLDGTHYGPQGAVRMGRAIATAMGVTLRNNILKLFDLPSLASAWAVDYGAAEIVSSDVNTLYDMGDALKALATGSGTGPDRLWSSSGNYARNAKAFATFDNAQDMLAMSAGLSLTDYSVFYVMYSSGTEIGLSNSASFNDRHIFSSSNPVVSHASDYDDTYDTYTDNQWIVGEVHCSGTDVEMVVNGVSLGTKTITAGFAPNALNNYSGPGYGGGPHQSCHLFDYVSGATRTTIRSLIANHANITVS